MSWPHDGLPRYKVSELCYGKSVDVAVLDRADCHRVVSAFPSSVEVDGREVPAGCPPLAVRRRMAEDLAATLNAAAPDAAEGGAS